MNWYLIDSDNIIINSIVYDGVSEYSPPEDTQLVSSENNYSIGDEFNE